MKTFKQLIDERCWPGYKPAPGKKAYAKGSCVKEEREADAGGADNPVFTKPKMKMGVNKAIAKISKEEYEADDGPLTEDQLEQLREGEAWTRKEGQSESGGLNRKGIESYRRANPGSNHPLS